MLSYSAYKYATEFFGWVADKHSRVQSTVAIFIV